MPLESDSKDTKETQGFYHNLIRFLTRPSGMRVFGGIGVEWQDATPVTTGSTTIRDGVGGIYLEHGSTIASHTVRLPVNPDDRQEVTIAARSTVTTLTLNSAGTATVRNAVTTITAGSTVRYCYRKSDDIWYRIG